MEAKVEPSIQIANYEVNTIPLEVLFFLYGFGRGLVKKISGGLANALGLFAGESKLMKLSHSVVPSTLCRIDIPQTLEHDLCVIVFFGLPLSG